MKTKLQNLLATALVCALAVIAHATDPKIEKKQQDIRNMAQQTLGRLYKAEPKAKSAIHSQQQDQERDVHEDARTPAGLGMGNSV